MTFFLLQGLQSLLEEALKNSLHVVPGGEEERMPQVFLGTLPAKNKETKDFPFVLVRAVGGKDDDVNGHLIDVVLIAGIYTEDPPPAGAHELYNVLDVCRGALRRQTIIDSRFSLSGKITWQVGGDTDRFFLHPQYLGTLTAQYTGPHYEAPLSEDFF